MAAPRHGYPLGALFVLVTACAVLIAGVTPLVRLVTKGDAPEYLLPAIIVGICCGFVVGSTLGLLQFRKGLGLAMGATTGTFIGAAAGGIALLKTEQLIPASIAMSVGSGLIVGVAVLMRRSEGA
jgi:hypothetical protein